MTSIIVGSASRRRTPTRASQAMFALKAAVFQVRRGVAELGRAPRRLARAADCSRFGAPVAHSVSPLWADPSLSERGLQMGKVQNLRRAAAALDGLELGRARCSASGGRWGARRPPAATWTAACCARAA